MCETMKMALMTVHTNGANDGKKEFMLVQMTTPATMQTMQLLKTASMIRILTTAQMVKMVKVLITVCKQ